MKKVFDLYYSNNIVDVNSEYFIKYKQLIEENCDTKKQKYKTAKHHIVPKSYYLSNNLEVDNSNYNTANLLHKYHALAHYYLFKCSIDKKFKSQNCIAIQRMFYGGAINPSKTIKDIKVLSKDDIDELINIYQINMEEVNKQFSSIGVESNKKRDTWFTDEQKNNISIATKKAMWREDVRAKTVAAYNSEEWRKKDSEHVKEQWRNTNLRDIVSAANGISVRCIETGIEYLSISRASSDTNISGYIISRQLKGIVKEEDTLHFERVKE